MPHDALPGVPDLRSSAEADLPEPLEPGDLAALRSALSRGASFREAFESLLLALPRTRSNHLMHLSKPSRGAWLVLLQSLGGRALLVGNPLSGTASALARCGFEVWLSDTSPERMELALGLLEHRVPGAARGVLLTPGTWPFADEAFDLLVLEEGLPGRPEDHAQALAECARIARELCFVVDNRLGYKRSEGRRKSFIRARPLDYARQVLRRSEKRTLFGYRKLCATRPELAWRSFALYPHRRDFTHVVELTPSAPKGGGKGEVHSRPELPLGPLERANRVKLAARAVGLFPVLTPSFAHIGTPRPASGATGPDRLQRVLRALAEEIGEPVPECQQLSGTQGNTGLILTRPAGADARARIPDPGGPGYWALHVLLSARTASGLAKHGHALAQLPGAFPALRVPELLFSGTLEGLDLTCERRLGGLRVFELSRAAAGRALQEASTVLQTLVEEDVVFDEEHFERLVLPKLDLQRRIHPVPSVHAQLDLIEAQVRALLIGRTVPLVLQHGDLRPKHVQCSASGALLGFLDWGSWRRRELPYYDLLHLAVHHLGQRQGLRDRDAHQRVVQREGLTRDELEALDGYAVRWDPDVRRAIEVLYPVLVADTASTHWDYDRPRWFEHKFGVPSS